MNEVGLTKFGQRSGASWLWGAGLLAFACTPPPAEGGSEFIVNTGSGGFMPMTTVTSGGGASTTAVVGTTTGVSINPSTTDSGGTAGTGGTGGTQGVTEVIITENCASTNVSATDLTTTKPVDIIFAIDSSGSMDEEILFVQTYMNDFSRQIVDSGVDSRVILLGSIVNETVMPPRNGICIDAPLGSGVCPEDTNLPGYAHENITVGSHNALDLIVATYSSWSQYLRPEAVKFFVVVTDDNAHLNGTSSDSETIASTFTNGLTALDAAMFSEWSMNGVYCFTDCPEAANVGSAYETLVAQTGGVAGDLCLQDFQPVFDRLAEQIIENAGAEIACEWDFPEVPEGQTFSADLIAVQRTGSNGTTTIPRVGSALECETQGGGWYYDDVGAPTQILACPSTCAEMQDDAAGQIDVVFGCEEAKGCAASSLTAENNVMGQDVVCEWELPDPPSGTILDSESVNVRFTNQAGVATELGKVPSAADCAMFSRGWYYDSEDNPQKVLVCPDVCSMVQEGGVKTQVDILLGCTTKPAEVK